ncbi:MAG: hypothetical protein QM762_13900 [Chryseolinea sp.]
MPPELSDPYLESFRDKGIKYVISEKLGRATDPFPDTIQLDRLGNVQRIRRYGEEERRAYNDSNFLVRRWLRSDVTVQYDIRYSMLGDTLVQSWRELNSRNWDSHQDTSGRQRDVNLFVFDPAGRIAHEFTDGVGPVDYIYDKNILVRKETLIRRNNEEDFHMETVADFKYDDLGKIKFIRDRKLNGSDSEV